MKTIIAGSRHITDYALLLNAIASLDWTITEVVSGTCRGVDKLGAQYARENDLPLHKFPAQWGKYGKRAGYLRNAEMAENAGACLVLWDGESRGSKMMVRIARERGLELHEEKI